MKIFIVMQRHYMDDDIGNVVAVFKNRKDAENLVPEEYHDYEYSIQECEYNGL